MGQTITVCIRINRISPNAKGILQRSPLDLWGGVPSGRNEQNYFTPDFDNSLILKILIQTNELCVPLRLRAVYKVESF